MEQDQTTNNATTAKKGKKSDDNRSRTKPLTGKQMYEHKFMRSDVPFKELGIGTPSQSKDADKLLGYMKRKLNGASKRKANIVKLIRQLDGEIRTRAEIRNGEKLPLAEFEWIMKKAKKKQAEANLIIVNEEVKKYRQFFEEQLSVFVQPLENTIAGAREERYITRIAPSTAKKAMALLDAAAKNGKAEEIKRLSELVIPGKRDEFRDLFKKTIKDLEPLMALEFEKRPKLLTKVIDRVIAEYADKKEVK